MPIYRFQHILILLNTKIYKLKSITISMVREIINKINKENGSTYKLNVLKEHKDNELLQRVLKMTYDIVTYSYGITLKNIEYTSSVKAFPSLELALNILETEFCTRIVTGNKAKELLQNVLNTLNEEDGKIIVGIIERDQHLGIGKSTINKVWKNLVVKPPYSRCTVGSKKNLDKLNFKEGVFVQQKMDGTYRSALVQNGKVTFTSRSGQVQSFPLLEEQLLELDYITDKDYVLLGELTLRGEKDRQIGNGNINSSTPDHENIIFTVWDILDLEEYRMKNGDSDYECRFNYLKGVLNSSPSTIIDLVPTKMVYSLKEAYEFFTYMTQQGFEGAVAKSRTMKWKDGNSVEQLKLKLIIDLEMRFTGFTQGSGKNKDYFGAMTFENDDKTIVGKVGVSSFGDKLRNYIHENREEYLGKVFTIQCNDITKAKSNTTYALSHPRFIELRNDKDTTDTLERAFELKEMAMENK